MNGARLLSLLLLLALAGPARGQDDPPQRPRNVILFIADGLGQSGVSLARAFKQPLALDSILVGSVATASANSLVTDSAASATAMATGVLTNNGMVSVTPEGQPLRTLVEAAEEAGMVTGIIATSRLTHATPACFSSHVPSRNLEGEIAAQQIAQGIDLFLGGGRRWFLPSEREGSREDGRNLLTEARELGYTVIAKRGELLGDLRLPILGLFAEDHMAYEVDRDDAFEPSLAEMTRRAIELLGAHEGGFLLMVEGSRIDHAGHNNDVVGYLHDTLAYDAAVGVALRYARRDGQTLIVATADHETGGLALAADVPWRRGYGWDPAPLRQARSSHEGIARALEEGGDPVALARERLGVDDLTAAERDALQRAGERGQLGDQVKLLSLALAQRARIGWTTHGHTGVDVGLYAFGPGAEHFRGFHPVTVVGTGIARARGFELAVETR